MPDHLYMQSPAGLVPKSGGRTRLIFHLSYNFKDGKGSLNSNTPREKCSVKYRDLDTAVKQCLLALEEAKEMKEDNEGKTIFLGKTDLSMAFRVLPLKIKCFCWLVLKAEDPKDGKVKYFIDRCLPFRASISCALYQKFSNALKHITSFRTGRDTITNYLDDFLFIAFLRALCNEVIKGFMDICKYLNIPIAMEKTEWAESSIVFLGMLLDGVHMMISIPIEKRDKALRLLRDFSDKCKSTIKQIQVLTGYLNFLTRAIYAGRTFTRRMYAKGAMIQKGKILKPYHHVTLDAEFKFNCEIWKLFVENCGETAICRPMIDLDKSITAPELNFSSDASASEILGYGAVFDNEWLYGRWEPNYI